MTAVDVHVWKGQAAVTLRAGDYEATFLPGVAMLGASLRFRGEEYVGWPRPLAQFQEGKVTAIPLVHPWGNRLARWGYRAAGRRVDLRGLDLQVDTLGLPIHGNLKGARFEIVRLERGRLRARCDYAASPEKLAAFPFPHVIEVDVQLSPRGLRISTAVSPTANAPVPISFCWHPYLRIPGARRRDWVLRWPACEHVEVDARVIPTGARTAQPAERAPLARRIYDDHYALGSDRRFSLGANGRALQLTFDRNYPFAQLYVPPRGDFVAIEPMTATINALGTGDAVVCAAGERFRATFTVACTA